VYAVKIYTKLYIETLLRLSSN